MCGLLENTLAMGILENTLSSSIRGLLESALASKKFLNDLIPKMLPADHVMESDTGGARHIYRNIRAYIKVQRKQISEAASKELIRTLVLILEAN
jgi:hypothetical protein